MLISMMILKAHTFTWLRGGTAITGATNTSYTLVAADSGQSITFEVTPVAVTGTITGSAGDLCWHHRD